jgi:hypothetical protein
VPHNNAEKVELESDGERLMKICVMKLSIVAEIGDYLHAMPWVTSSDSSVRIRRL